MHQFFRVRHRYVFTKSNRLRLRYVFGCFLISAFMLTSLLGSSPSSIAHAPEYIEDISGYDDPDVSLATVHPQDILPSDDGVDGKLAPLLLSNLPQDDDLDLSMIEQDDQGVAAEKGEVSLERVLKVGSGDTVAGILQSVGLNGAEVFRIVKAMSKHYDPRSIKAGQAISVTLEHAEEGQSLKSLKIKMDAVRQVIVEKDEHERFSSRVDTKEIVLRKKMARASIQNSLYGSAARAGIPASLVANIIRIYSYEVDFQRDLRRGDTVELVYEVYETEDGGFARYGDILYANLGVRGEQIPVYRYEKSGGHVDYYKSDGSSLKRTLMQTPIDGGRISSGYGMRKHPVLGYNKMHKGVDFAAPSGTPIYAAGDGVIDKIGRNGGYGNYIRIKHNGTLKTAYAHMRRFSKGMTRGKRVKQGQVIGYVGTTGRSTGPHLHFEVLKNGQQINPKKIKTADRVKLAGSELKRFNNHVSSMGKKYTALSEALKIAQNEAAQ